MASPRFSTYTITLMLGWVVKHFEKGKQWLYLLILNNGSTLPKILKNECTLNHFFFPFYHTYNYLSQNRISSSLYIQAFILHMLICLQIIIFPYCYTYNIIMVIVFFSYVYIYIYIKQIDLVLLTTMGFECFKYL
jgi:hypothetical protein